MTDWQLKGPMFLIRERPGMCDFESFKGEKSGHEGKKLLI